MNRIKIYNLLNKSEIFQFKKSFCTVAYRRACWGVQTPLKLGTPSKIVPKSTRLWKLIKINEFRAPTPQDVRKNGSKILKLPSIRSCFILAMTNKLVFIINRFKIPKIKKILQYGMKFLVPNYSCFQNPCVRGYRPQIPILSILKWICWNSPKNSWVLHWFSRNVYCLHAESWFKSFIFTYLFYLRFCFGPDVCKGNFGVKFCGVMPLPVSVRSTTLRHTHTIISQNFTQNFFLHTNLNSHETL